MKKTYISPETEIVNIQTQPLLEASAGFGTGTMGGGDAASRRHFNVWDEWDDNDEFMNDIVNDIIF